MGRWTIAQVGGAVVSGLYTAASLFLGIQQLYPSWPWQLNALIGFVVFVGIMTWMVSESRIELWRIKHARPNIVLSGIDENFLGNVTTRGYNPLTNQRFVGVTEHPNFTRIWIANDPTKTIEEVDAIKLYGVISVYKNGQELFNMGGRWAQKDEIADGGKPIEINQLDLPPNGMPVCFDIGLKYHDEDEFYGYNNETPERATKGFRDVGRQLGKGNYHVKVRFRCKGVDKTFWFQLTNTGAGQDVKFFEATEPPVIMG